MVGGGFLLRVFHLGAQSLWSDEGWTVAFSSQDLSSIVAFVDNEHTPVYYLLLHLWMALSGSSEFSVRFLSAVFGALLVALSGALGKRLFGRLIGLMAAFLAAISPFLVYYSQEARMHMLASFFALLSTYLFVRAVEDNRRALWLCYGLASAVALSLFTYTVLLLLAQAAFFLLFHRGRRQLRGGWLLSQSLVAVVGAGWAARNLLPLVGYLDVRLSGLQSLSLMDFLAQSWTALSLGLTVSGERVGLLILPFGALFFVGVASLPFRPARAASEPSGPRSRWGLLPLILLVVPVAVSFLINLVVPHFLPRYLLWVTPFYGLILARGLYPWGGDGPFLGRPSRGIAWGWPVVGLSIITVLSSLSLWNNYYDPRFARDDYRSLARHIMSWAHPQDAIILNARWQRPTFDYYYRGELSRYGLPQEFPLDESLTSASLENIIERHRGLWLVLYGNGGSDPDDFVERWLDGHCRRIAEEWFGGVRLVRYQVPLPPSFDLSRLAHRLELRMGEQMELLGYELDSDLVPGQPLHLTLYWRALEAVGQDYTVFIHLLDAEGRRWGQWDGQPLAGGYPTSAWEPGEVIRDSYRLEVSPQAPPGQYHLEVGMYLLATLERLPVLDGEGQSVGDAAVLGPMVIGEEGVK